MYLSPGEYFDKYWESYQVAVKNDLLYHKDMFTILKQTLDKHFSGKSFSFADFGCGDCESLASVLQFFPVEKFLGVDAAETVLAQAPKFMASVSGEKKFLHQDMLLACSELEACSFDVIFSSYALHHFTVVEKIAFIKNCQRSLKPGGLFILVDGVRTKGQNREEWLQIMEDETKTRAQDWAEQKHAIEHMRSSDFPEASEFFAELAISQNWQDFQILNEQDYCAFMLFRKF